jgi:hypothetical protein
LEIHAIILSTKWWLGVWPGPCVTSDLEAYIVHSMRHSELFEALGELVQHKVIAGLKSGRLSFESKYKNNE